MSDYIRTLASVASLIPKQITVTCVWVKAVHHQYGPLILINFMCMDRIYNSGCPTVTIFY